MENGYELKVTGDKLVITFDLLAAGVPSGTGKTILVATSRAAIPINFAKRPGLKITFNLMAPNNGR